ncbi:hypothetical protein JVU11DRAFT_5201 [Chiua virens]|nr:hypothetical protein JVU11DRAFT_5201 [Chiua virens]
MTFLSQAAVKTGGCLPLLALKVYVNTLGYPPDSSSKPTMVEPRAIIRPYKPDDEKLVKFTLGLAAMEGLAVANRQAAFHPLTLSLWVALSCIMIQLLHWWPKQEYGWLGWLLPLPAFGCWGVPVLFAIDWINRPYFEEVATDLMHRADFADLKYYARSPSSGLFILEYGDKFVGLVAIDASTDSQSEERIVKKNKKGRIQVVDKHRDFYSTGTSSVATIRHFFVEERFRKSDVQQDILEFAARHVFSKSKQVKILKASSTPLVGYKYNAFRKLGLSVEKQSGKVGILGWRVDMMSLERAKWEENQNKESSNI